MYSRNRIVNRLVPALIKMESNGNPNAVSSVGAQGLMQLMPATATRFGVTNPFDPKQNIAGGTKYLEFLAKRYNNDPKLIAAAYHAGEGNVDNWLAGKPSGVGKKTKAYMKDAFRLAGFATPNTGQPLKDGGFQSYQKRPLANDDKFPITHLPDLEPAVNVIPFNTDSTENDPMAVKQQAVSGNLIDFSKQQKKIDQDLLKAKAFGNVDWGDPNAQISGRAVAMHPLTALAKALQQGMAIHYAKQAQDQQSDLNTQKSEALINALRNGTTDLASLASSGLIEPEQLGAALTKQSSTNGDYQFIPGEDGKWLVGNKHTGGIEASNFRNPTYSPDAQFRITGAKNANQLVKVTDSDGRESYVPASQANNYYNQFIPGQGQSQEQDYTYSTGMLGNSGNPIVPATREQFLGQTRVIKSPTPAETTAQIEAAKQPYEMANAQLKQQMDIGTAKAKQAISNQGDIEKKQAEAQLKAQQELPDVQANTDYTLGLIDEIINHPGLSASVGLKSPSVLIPGTDAQGFAAKMEQLKGKQFLEAFQSLKGGGQITEIEGKKATDAIAALNTAQSEDDFKKELGKLREVVIGAQSRLVKKAGGGATGSWEDSDELNNLLDKYK